MVTIKQIAQEVGISSSTVSIVLGGKAAERKISTATQEKIFAAAARLGYQPNMAARSLRGGSGANELVVAASGRGGGPRSKKRHVRCGWSSIRMSTTT